MNAFRRFLYVLSISCTLAIFCLVGLVPDFRSAESLVQAAPPWGGVILGLWVIVLASWFGSVAITLVRRNQLAAMPWPAGELQPLPDGDTANPDFDINVRFDGNGDVWIFEMREVSVAALRDFGRRRGISIKVYGREYAITPRRFRLAGSLSEGDRKLAEFRTSAFNGRFEIRSDDSNYEIRRRFWSVINRRYQMSSSSGLTAEFVKSNWRKWMIHQRANVPLHVLAFAFWIILESIEREGS